MATYRSTIYLVHHKSNEYQQIQLQESYRQYYHKTRIQLLWLHLLAHSENSTKVGGEEFFLKKILYATYNQDLTVHYQTIIESQSA